MPYVLSALAVFWVIRIAKGYFSLPSWAWNLVRLALSVGAVIVAIDKGHWYYSLSVAGGSALIEMVDDLLMVKSDELLSRIRRPR